MDHEAPFRRIPWIAELLDQPDIICRVPGSRSRKKDTEDSLMAVTFKNATNLESYLCFYRKPVSDADRVEEVSTVAILGDGMNGHHNILHGGIVATLIDEAMGVTLGTNMERIRTLLEKGELTKNSPSFTAELKVRYLKPVRTPGALMVTAKIVRQEGRKEWINTELKQWQSDPENKNGRLVVCATGEGLFIIPKLSRL